MNKVTAHAILGVFDIAAIAACLYVFSEWGRVNQLFDQRKQQAIRAKQFKLLWFDDHGTCHSPFDLIQMAESNREMGQSFPGRPATFFVRRGIHYGLIPGK